MATIQISAAANAAKKDFTVETTADVAPTVQGANEIGVLWKHIPAPFNFQMFHGLLIKAVEYALTARLLDAIANGDYAASEYVMVSIERDGGITLAGVADGAGNPPYTAAPVDSVSLIIPVVNDWVANGSTVELTSFAKRIYERFLEDYAKLN